MTVAVGLLVLAAVHVGPFSVEVRTFHPEVDARALAVTADGGIWAGTARGLVRRERAAWTEVRGLNGAPVEVLAAQGKTLLAVRRNTLYRVSEGRAARMAALPPGGATRSLAAADRLVVAGTDGGVFELIAGQWQDTDGPAEVRQVVAGPKREIAAAAASGLYRRAGGGQWEVLYPQEGVRSWAPRDVRGVAYDSRGRLWFASPQGVGRFDGVWKLWSGEDGLPYDDFTSVAAGEDGVVWFGTRRGAIRFDGVTWEYRQGLRWLPDDAVRAVAVNREGHAWLATAKGLGLIERRPMRLAEKAAFFEEEIDRRHRRTPWGYVHSVNLPAPGDTSAWTQTDSDNDGLWTGMYGAGECFAYAATKSPEARRRARSAFEALRFLIQVTQGGEHPAPPGFPARAILPASGPDPNATHYTRERDEETRRTRDRLWKVMWPRWPRSADRQWFWKGDTSSDELDGHYFFYAQYYDLVADEQEKSDVRQVVQAITDHLLDHDYALVDWDGLPTRWAVFSPAKLNRDPAWWSERGLNSLSLLSYLKVAEHMTGEARYHEAAERLIRDHGYANNLLVPKVADGIGGGNQSDDEMGFMSFYNLVRYEQDPARRKLYCLGFYRYWRMEQMELNPLFHFLYAGACAGESFTDAFRTTDLSPSGAWLEDSADTLRRFPLDRIDWGLANSHRKDLVLAGPGRGYRRNGKVLPVDERHFDYWNHDPFRLDTGGQGWRLADGAAFTLPYYLGLYLKQLEE